MGNACGQTQVSNEQIRDQNTEDYPQDLRVSGDKATQTQTAKRFLKEGASKDLLANNSAAPTTQKSLKITGTIKSLQKVIKNGTQKHIPLQASDSTPLALDLLGKFEVNRSSNRNYNLMRIEAKDFVGAKSGKPDQDYEMLGEIGSGGYGQVFKAKDLKNGEIRAIKRVNKREMSKQDHYALLNEIQTLKKLDHPNILKIYDTYQDQEYCFIVMQLCEGGTLYDLVNEFKLNQNEVKKIMSQILKALNYIHGHSIVHRDIKLENIMISSSIETEEDLNEISIRLIDFGISVDVSKAGQSQSISGTLIYMPPEYQSTRLSTLWDMWSCGIMLYIISTLKLPYIYSNDQELKGRIQHAQVIRKHMSTLSKDLRIFINGLLEANIGKRTNASRALKSRWITSESKASIKKSVKKAMAHNFVAYNPTNNLISLIQSYLIFSKMGKCERDRLGMLFNELDTDHSGKIELRELQAFLETAKPQYMDHEEAMSIASNLDKDKSGTIDFNEFLVAMFDRKGLYKEEALSETFKFLDKDKSGFLEKEELRKVLQGADQKQIEDLFKLIDFNTDDKISIEQFMKYLLSSEQNSEES